MKFPRLLFAIALSCAVQPAASEESFQGALQRGIAAHPSLYSFTDLYRLAAAEPMAGFSIVQANEAPVRTAVAPPSAQFAISEVREPQRGLLLLSGLMLAVWVARRRLGYTF